MMSRTTCTKHNCEYHDELLSLYASGNASPEERQRAEKWLAQCPDCRRKVMELEQTWWVLDIWEEDQRHVPLRLNHFHERLNEIKNQQPLWRRVLDHTAGLFRPLPLMPTASLGAAVIVVLAVFYQPVLLETGTPINFPALQFIHTSNDSILPQHENQQRSTANMAFQQEPNHQGNQHENQNRRETFFDQQVQLARYAEIQRARSSSSRNYTQTAGTQNAGFVPNRNIVSALHSLDDEIQLRPGYIRNPK